MKASVSYQELQKMIYEKAKQPISFEFVDQKTIKLLYDLNLGFIKKKISFDIKVLGIEGTDLKMQYATDLNMDGVVNMALSMAGDKIPAGVLEELPGCIIMVHLDKVEKIKPFFDRVDVKDINMLADAVEMVGDFK